MTGDSEGSTEFGLNKLEDGPSNSFQEQVGDVVDSTHDRHWCTSEARIML